MTRTLLAILVAILAGGCAKKIPIKDAHTLLAVEGDPKVSKNGVTLTVTPVDVRNYLSEVQQFTYEDRWPICREEGGQLVNATVGGIGDQLRA